MRRLLFLLIWLSVLSWAYLTIFASEALRSLRAPIPSGLIEYLRLLPLFILAGFVALVATRFAWTVSFLLGLIFFPIGLLLRAPVWIFRALRGAIRLPSRIRRILASAEFNVILVTLVIYSVLAVLQSWYPSLLRVFLSMIVLAVITMLVHAVTLVFRPALFHRFGVNLLLTISRMSRLSLEMGQPRQQRPLVKTGKFAIEWPEPDKAATLQGQHWLLEGTLRRIRRAREGTVPLKAFLFLFVGYYASFVFLFGVSFWGLESGYPGSLAGQRVVSFFDVLIFSVTNMMTVSYGDVVPVSTTARLLAVLQLVSALTIGVVLLSVFVAFGQERYNRELDETIRDIEGELQILAPWKAPRPNTLTAPAQGAPKSASEQPRDSPNPPD